MSARLIRLDAEAEVDDRVDVGMARDELQHLGNRVARLAAREVDRVVAAPARRELLVDRGAQIVGQRRELEAGAVRAIASAVTTPQPPAVVTTAVAAPCGRGWVANVAAASNASSIVVARVMPAWRHMPSKTRSSEARLPVWLAAARWPPAVVPPFTSTTGLRRGDRRRAVEERRGRRRHLPRTRGSPRSRRRRRTSRGSRRRRRAAALPALTARLTPTPVCTAQFSNDETKLPDWLAIAIRPAGG